MTDFKSDSSLIGIKAFPAISILLPTHTPEAGITNFRERLAQLLRQAEFQLTETYSKAKATGLMTRLHHVVNGIDLSSTGSGLAIYVSDGIEKIFHLPFQVTEKLVIDESFEIRDLLYAAKINRSYMLVLISRNEVRTLMGYGKALLTVNMEGMPENIKDVTTHHSLPGWDYLDKKAFDEGNLNKFIHFIDTTIHREMIGQNIPLIIFGDSKILGHYKKTSKMTKDILDFVEGNFEHASKKELLHKIEPSLLKLAVENELKAMKELEIAVSKNQVASGISQVWRVAAEARGRILLVEKEYRESARLGPDGYTLIVDNNVPSAHNRIEDAVDDIIEMVLKNKGDIVFVKDGSLADFQKIAIINRY